MKNLLLSASKESKFNFKRFSRGQTMISIQKIFMKSVITKDQLFLSFKVTRIDCLEDLLHLTGKIPLEHTMNPKMIKNHF